MRPVFLIYFLLVFTNLSLSQEQDSLALRVLYDRTLSYNEEKLDSIAINSRYIGAKAQKIGYASGEILANRLMGLYYEYSGDYKTAISFYLRTLTQARSLRIREYEIAALSDLAIVYSEIKQPLKAKDVYLQSLNLSLQFGEIHNIITSYTNIGAIYNQLSQPDSALFYLTRALEMSNSKKDSSSLSVIYNNTGNVYFRKKEYPAALRYFHLNKRLHEEEKQKSSLWYDNLNIADTHLESGSNDSAMLYANVAMEIATQLNSKQKEADTHSLLARLFAKTGQFEKAYEHQSKWYSLDTALVNQASNQTIAEMQERFNARDRDIQNQLLMAEIEKANLSNKNLSILVVAAALISLLVGITLLLVKRTNRKLKEVNQQIQRQKEKLAELNQEKNSLIGIVSHDLGAPLSSISMWTNLIEQEADLTHEQKKALERIRSSAANGEKLIRRILEVERYGTAGKQIDLEETDVAAFLCHLVQEFMHTADMKNINLLGPVTSSGIFLLTDQDMLRRIIENLVGNAIKFTPPGKSVRVELFDRNSSIDLMIEDEGPGVPENERQLLFTSYSQLTARPTGGESSSGLGLSIVKRLLNELNGMIRYEEVQHGGSRFIVSFKK